MKNLRLIIFFIAGMFTIASCSSGQQYAGTKLKTKEDTVSYFLGITYGSSLKQAEVDKIFNYDAFAKGIVDASKSDTMPVSEIEINAYLSMFFEEFQEDQLKIQYEDYIAENKAFLDANAKEDSVVSLPSGLQYKILEVSAGPQPVDTDEVKVNYTGWLIDGTKFDSSYDRGEPAVFPVNAVIPGWSEAIKLMPLGSKWKVWIPEDMAYGSMAPEGSQIIPFSTLVFEIELLEINPAQ
ncbi:MAG: FKBP-type peptidyl-prolyl cis-trans isomerase [Bacteroidales bacterium]|nr:FKBP-type peptidyl-prolyl cis-trans isomerase [Bacteroidales bacterium]